MRNQRKRGVKGFKSKTKYVSTIVRKLEGRWDLIESCLATLDEANSIAVSATVETEGVVKP